MRAKAINSRQPVFYERHNREPHISRGYVPPPRATRWQRFRRYVWGMIYKRRHLIGGCIEALICSIIIALFTAIFWGIAIVIVPLSSP
jgi:hypothetical protein